MTKHPVFLKSSLYVCEQIAKLEKFLLLQRFSPSALFCEGTLSYPLIGVNLLQLLRLYIALKSLLFLTAGVTNVQFTTCPRELFWSCWIVDACSISKET